MTKITKEHFAVLNGREVYAYTLTEGEMSVRILTYGGILQSVVLPDKNGVKRDVLLGYDTLEGYLLNLPHRLLAFGDIEVRDMLALRASTIQSHRNFKVLKGY